MAVTMPQRPLKTQAGLRIEADGVYVESPLLEFEDSFAGLFELLLSPLSPLFALGAGEEPVPDAPLRL